MSTIVIYGPIIPSFLALTKYILILPKELNKLSFSIMHSVVQS